MDRSFLLLVLYFSHLVYIDIRCGVDRMSSNKFSTKAVLILVHHSDTVCKLVQAF